MPRRLRPLVLALVAALTGAGVLAGCRSGGDADRGATSLPPTSQPSTSVPSTTAPSTTVPSTADPTATVVAGTDLAVGDLAAAVAAVEKARGGPQSYTEINAIPQGVNLFVSVDGGQEVSYVYAAGQLLDPGAPTDAQGTPFALDDVDLTAPSRIVTDVQTAFPGAVVQQVALVQLGDQGLVWAVQSKSAKGGLLALFYGPKGDLRSVTPAGG